MGLVPIGVVTDLFRNLNFVMDELFEELVSGKNINLAYEKAIKNKRFRPDVLKFSRNSEKHLVQMKNKLSRKTYSHGGYFNFIVNDSKKRIIWAAQFPDRIIHHALCNMLEPIFEKSFIFDSYACRKEKGVQKAIFRCQKFIRTSGGQLKRKKNLLF